MEVSDGSLLLQLMSGSRIPAHKTTLRQKRPRIGDSLLFQRFYAQIPSLDTQNYQSFSGDKDGKRARPASGSNTYYLYGFATVFFSAHVPRTFDTQLPLGLKVLSSSARVSK
jgi:hypothetical protein